MDVELASGGGGVAIVLPARAPATSTLRRLLGRLLIVAGAVLGFWLLGSLLGSSRATAAPVAPVAPVVKVTAAGGAVDVKAQPLPSAWPVVRSAAGTVRTVVPGRVAPVVRTVPTHVTRTVSRVGTDLGRTVHAVAPKVPPVLRALPVSHVPVRVGLPHLPARAKATATQTPGIAETERSTGVASYLVQSVRGSGAGSVADRLGGTTVDHRAGRSHAVGPFSPQPTTPGVQPVPGIEGGADPTPAGSGDGAGLAAADLVGQPILMRPMSSTRLTELTASAHGAALAEPTVSPD